jgi:hypothetical protein
VLRAALLIVIVILGSIASNLLLESQQALAASAVVTNGAMPPPVSIEDSSDNSVSRVSEVNETLKITRGFINQHEKERSFVCFFEIRNSDGVTVFLEMLNGSAKPQNQSHLSISWLPEHKETFEVRTIIISNLTNPEFIDYPTIESLTIIDRPNPISVVTKPSYKHLEEVVVMGKVASGYANFGDPIEIRLSTPGSEAYKNATTEIRDNGRFTFILSAADMEIGHNTVSVSLPGMRDSMTNASFVYGHPILKGVLDSLKPFDLHFANNDTYQIKYQLTYGIVRDIVPQGSANYTIAFKIQMADEGAFVIQIPYSLLDKMTPLNDRDMIFFIDGNQMFPEQVIATREYGAFFAFIPPETGEIIVATRLE